MDAVKINNINFKYGNNVIFDNLELTIKSGKWYNLIGSNGAGKSTLVKILSGLIKVDGIFIDGIEISNNNLYEIRKRLSIVFEDPNTNLICDTVREELSFPLLNIGKMDDKKINDIAHIFEIDSILDEAINSLSNSQKQIVAIASAVIVDPTIIVLDEALTYLGNKKMKIFDILKSFKMTVINITHDMEDTLYGDNIIIMANKKIIINDRKEKVFKNPELFKEAKQELPFIIDLSIKLKYYSLVDKLYYKTKDLVDDLWK